MTKIQIIRVLDRESFLSLAFDTFRWTFWKQLIISAVFLCCATKQIMLFTSKLTFNWFIQSPFFTYQVEMYFFVFDNPCSPLCNLVWFWSSQVRGYANKKRIKLECKMFLEDFPFGFNKWHDILFTWTNILGQFVQFIISFKSENKNILNAKF